MSNNTTPLVSICVPVFNVATYIERCALSLFEQSYTNIEYIFVDDCSTDNSIALLNNIIAQYPNRKDQVSILSHKANRGCAASRNTAIQNSTGEYVITVDADDWLALETVERCVAEVNKEGVDLIRFGGYNVYRDRKEAIDYVAYQDKEVWLQECLRRKASFRVAFGFYRKTLFTEHNIACYEPFDMGEDYVVFPRLLYYAQRPMVLAERFYFYDRGIGNSITSRHSDKSMNALLENNRRLNQFFLDLPNAYAYIQSLNYGKTSLAVDLLKDIGKNGQGIKPQRLTQLFQLINDVPFTIRRQFSADERLLLRLRYRILLKLYVKAGQLLKQFKKR